MVAIWRQGYGRKAGLVGQPQGSDRAAKSLEAGQALLAMCRDNPGRVETFLAEEGGVVLVELLQEPCNERVSQFSDKKTRHGTFLLKKKT